MTYMVYYFSIVGDSTSQKQPLNSRAVFVPLNDEIKRKLRVKFKIEREAQLLSRHSERGGTPRVESPTAEK